MKRHVIADSNRGIYIPQFVARYYLNNNFSKFQITGQEDLSSDLSLLLEDLNSPENELYWDSWNEVINVLRLIDTAGNTWRIEEDGDCFLEKEN